MVLTKKDLNEILQAKEEIIIIAAENPTVVDEISKYFDVVIQQGNKVLNNVIAAYTTHMTEDLDEMTEDAVKDTLYRILIVHKSEFMPLHEFGELLEVIVGVDKELGVSVYGKLLIDFFVPALDTCMAIRKDLDFLHDYIELIYSIVKK